MARIPASSGAGYLAAAVTVDNSDGTQTSDSFILDQGKLATVLPPLPMVQTHEMRFSVKGGETNTIKVTLSKGGGAVNFTVNAVDVVYEILKR